MPETYYKFLTEQHTGGVSKFDWTPYLPQGDQPGEWTPAVEGELVDCENGYHLLDASQILGDHIQAEMYEAEAREIRPAKDGEKHVCRQVRLLRRVDGWNDKALRLFAVWCAREALKLIGNPDPRSVAACDVAERFANGEATEDKLSAARDAAWDAAWDAARDAAWAAAWAAARDAAWAAARDAARDAAWDAAWATAWATARAAARAAAWDAQIKQLHQMIGLV